MKLVSSSARCFVALLVSVQVQVALCASTSLPTLGFSNTTSTITTAPSATGACCFVVQDTVSEVYWERLRTRTTYYVINVTSITTFLTPFSGSTHTNFKTNVYTSNATFITSTEEPLNPVSLYPNSAVITPVEKVLALWTNSDGAVQTNGNFTQDTTPVFISSGQALPTKTDVQLSTGGTVVASPTPFWVYSKIRIITAAAVKNGKGEAVCGTTSSIPNKIVTLTSYRTSDILSKWTDTFTDVTTLYTTLSDGFISGTKTKTVISTHRDTLTQESYIPTATYTSLSIGPTYTNINKNAEAYFGSKKQEGVVIELKTPYVHIPNRTLSDADGGEFCSEGDDTSNYGAPVQGLIDFLAKDPYYVSLYPNIGACLPAAPTIIEKCTAIPAPAFEVPGGDLTDGTVIIVTPTAAPAAGQTQPPAVPAQPTPQPPAQPEPPKSPDPQPPTDPAQPTPQPPAQPEPPKSPDPQPPVSDPDTTQPNVVVPAPSPSNPVAIGPGPTNDPPPVANSPPQNNNPPVPAEPNTADAIAPVPTNGANPPNANQPAPVAPSGSTDSSPPKNNADSSDNASPNPSDNPSDDNVGAIVASIIGAIPNKPAPTPSPPGNGQSTNSNPVDDNNIEALPGTTTIVSGVLNVILPGSTAVPLNPALTGLKGKTTVVGSQTYVVIINPTSIQVATQTASGSSNTSIPLQIEGSAPRRKAGFEWLFTAFSVIILIIYL